MRNSHFFSKSSSGKNQHLEKKKQIQNPGAKKRGWVFLDLPATFGIFEWLFGETFRRIHLVSEWKCSWWFVKARIQNPQKVGKLSATRKTSSEHDSFLIKWGTWKMILVVAFFFTFGYFWLFISWKVAVSKTLGGKASTSAMCFFP